MIGDFLELPLHPLVVHFPVAMLTVTWVLIVAGHGSSRRGGRYLSLVPVFEWIGVVAFPPTVLTGLRDAGWTDLFDERDFDGPLLWHAAGGVATVLVFTAHVIWRHGREIDERSAGVDLGLSTLGFWLLLTTGLLAGEVVYG